MAENELNISGISIAQGVVKSIVARAAEQVEGVARVGGNDITSSLVRVFTSRSMAPGSSVDAEVVDGKLHTTVHLAVFYGYPFTKLAAAHGCCRCHCVAGGRRGRFGRRLHRQPGFPQGVSAWQEQDLVAAPWRGAKRCSFFSRRRQQTAW